MDQPSIQSFYRREVPSESPSPDKGTSLTVGFTEDELHPLGLRSWEPSKPYPLRDIGDLRPSIGRVNLCGRIVGLFHQPLPSAKPPKAQGFFKLVLKDDTGAINVKLHYAQVIFDFTFGTLCSVWAIHVAAHDPKTLTSPNQFYFITMFPERDPTCHIEVLEDTEHDSVARLPLEYAPPQPLPGLMTLQDYLNGGHELAGSKILVVVKSIGQRKRITVHRNTEAERIATKLDVRILDDTAECALILWGDTHADSAGTWTPNGTVLLISEPAYKPPYQAGAGSSHSSSHGTSSSSPRAVHHSGPGHVVLSAKSLLEVDPSLPDASWLRTHAQGKAKRHETNPCVPAGVFDLQQIVHAEERILFSLADMDDYVRHRPNEAHVGWFSVILFELGITKLQVRGQLCSGECCSLPLYANTTSTVCTQCSSTVTLRLNPRMLATLADATGSIHGAALAVADEAWPRLLGRSADDLCNESLARLKQRQARMLYMRVTLIMGWDASGQRMVVLGVES